MASTFKIKNNDVYISPATGRPVVVSGPDKLRQELKEFFEIEVTPSGFGAGLPNLVGLVSSDDESLMFTVYGLVSNGLDRYKALQMSDTRIPRPSVELILDYSNLNVVQDTTDPTKYVFTVDIRTKSGIVVPFSGYLRS